MKDIPLWITELEADELKFIRNFVLASGSLKEMASNYGVSYPTVRSRLNNVINHLHLIDHFQEERNTHYV